MLIQQCSPLVARTFIAIIFIYSGLAKMIGFSGVSQQISSVGIPIAGLVAFFTIVFEIGGGASVLFGYKAPVGATLLVLFLIPATLVFHNPIADPTQITQFLKNLAIVGGLLLVVVYGAGPVSIDGHSSGSRTASIEKAREEV